MTQTAQVRLFSEQNHEELWLYRTLCGDPEHILPSLRLLQSWRMLDQLPADVSICASWLIVIGMKEYNRKDDDDHPIARDLGELSPIKPETNRIRRAWRIGSYEPCAKQVLCQDIEWFYDVNVDTGEIQIGIPEVTPDDWGVTIVIRDDATISPKEMVTAIDQQMDHWKELPKILTADHPKRYRSHLNFFKLCDGGRVWNSNLILKP